MECNREYRRRLMSGKGNHQYGLRGKLNASFTSIEIPKMNNNVTERMIYVGEWHKDAVHGRVKQHRFLIEQNHQLFNPDFFEEIDGWCYLRDGVVIHHRDLDHNNNVLSNLMPMTKAEHISLHNRLREQKRDKYGRFINNDTE